MNNSKTQIQNQRSKYTEDWIPVKAIENGMIILDNKMRVTGVKIRPRNIFILEQSVQDNVIIGLKNFYNTIGGQWKKDASKDDYVKGYRYLIEEVKELHLDNGKADFIRFIENEKRAVLNLSLGTTIKISMPIQELAKKDVNFDKDNDELAKAIYDLIMKYKNEIEDKVRK